MKVAGHEFVYRELLIGDPAGRIKLLAAYQQMHQVSIVPYREVAHSFAIGTCIVQPPRNKNFGH